jgi:alkylation response protein AidB-like acyl-CoA dehydrogenase
MDFNDTPAEAEYRKKALDFLTKHAPMKRLGQPSLSTTLAPADLLAAAQIWQKKKADYGFSCITWSKEYGGPGGSAIESIIFSQEEARFDVPLGIYQVSLGVCMPAILKLGSETIKQRFACPALRGEEIWCQLFSEPGAGSDLAGVRTRAISEGENWVVNGQKVWTSNAHLSDFGLLLARTDPTTQKHKGLTMFWVDMSSPGIEIRPIHQMTGKRGFNEVYFSDVSIPDSQRLSDVHAGWKAALVTLATERLAIGGAKGADYEELVALARQIPCDDKTVMQDGGFRQRLADWYVNSEGVKLTRLRTMTALSRGETPGPESSIGKFIMAAQLQDLSDYAMDLQGQFGTIHDSDRSLISAAFQDGWLKAPGSRLAGGTDEILLNIIAERILGLPSEIRVDKEKPFNELPVGR